MIYLDTCIIVSAVDELDPNHAKALKLLEELSNENRVVSKLTLVELASVFTRANLDKPIALAIYAIKKVNAKIISTDFNEVLSQALRYAHELRLKTLDLLHVISCRIIGATRFATFDRDIISKAARIRKVLGIEVVSL